MGPRITAQRHFQRHPQAVRAAVEVQPALAALHDSLDDGQAEPAAAALAVAPETPGEVRQVGFGDARTVVADVEARAALRGFHRQLHPGAGGGVAQGVVQQVAQRGDGQHRGDFQRRLGQAVGQLQLEHPHVAVAGVVHGYPGGVLGAALHAVVERQAAFHPRQQQQLVQRPVQTVGAFLGVGQGLLGGGALGHARDLQVGLDRGQRAAQLVGGIAGQASLAFDGLGDALEQLVLGFHQRLQFARQGRQLQWLQRVGATSGEGVANPLERRQALAGAEPEQGQAAEQGDGHRHRGGHHHRALQHVALFQAVGGADPQIAGLHGEAAPQHAVDFLVAEAAGGAVQRPLRGGMALRQDFAAQ